MLDFLFGRLFYTEMLLAGFSVASSLPRRNGFPLRVAAAVSLSMAFSYFWAWVMRIVPASLVKDSVLFSAFVSYLIPFAVVLGGICLCFTLRRYGVFFVGAAMWFVQHISSVLDSLLFPNNGMDYSSYCIHMVFTLAVFVSCWFLLFRRFRSEVVESIDLHAAIPTWLIMSFACLFLGTYAESVEENSLSFKLMNLLCTTVGLLYQGGLYRVCSVRRERDGVQKLLEESERRYTLAKSSMEVINIKCHDLRHMIRHFQQQGRLDHEAFAQMEQSIREYDSAICTGCPALDVILSEKSAQCVSLGVGFTCMAEASGLRYIKPVDLYVLFSNALENALEAVQRVAEPEKRQISLNVRRIGDFCAVQLQNYTDRPLRVVDDLPVTSKSDPENHGFGVKSMTLLAERYDGELHLRQDGDVVELYLLLPCGESVAENAD